MTLYVNPTTGATGRWYEVGVGTPQVSDIYELAAKIPFWEHDHHEWVAAPSLVEEIAKQVAWPLAVEKPIHLLGMPVRLDAEATGLSLRRIVGPIPEEVIC